MISVYFVVSKKTISTQIQAIYNLEEHDLQYLGSESHSSLALRLAMVASPQIIVLDSSAPFVSLSKFVSMIEEADINCAIILLSSHKCIDNHAVFYKESSNLVAILDINDLTSHAISSAFQKATSWINQQSSISNSQSHFELPKEFIDYYLSSNKLTMPPSLASFFDPNKWIRFYLSIIVFPGEVTSSSFQSVLSFCRKKIHGTFFINKISPHEIFILSNGFIGSVLDEQYRSAHSEKTFSIIIDSAKTTSEIPTRMKELLNYSSQCRYFKLWNLVLNKNYFTEYAQKVLMHDFEVNVCHALHFIMKRDKANLKSTIETIFNNQIAPSLSSNFATDALLHLTKLNFAINLFLGPEYILSFSELSSSLSDDYLRVLSAFERCIDFFPKKYGEINSVLIDTFYYVCINYHTRHKLSDVTHTIGISTSYLCTMLKKTFGWSYIQILSEARMYHAKRIMHSHPEKSIKSIALEVGFEDARYFSRVFKTQNGLTPQEYCQIILKKQKGEPND